MDTIKVDREQLLEKLQENRAKHEAEYAEAMQTWVAEATTRLREVAREAEDNGWIEVEPLRDLPKPQSYLKSYDDAIARVEFDVRDVVELDDREFSAWVQDDWNWRGAFVASTRMYNNAR